MVKPLKTYTIGATDRGSKFLMKRILLLNIMTAYVSMVIHIFTYTTVLLKPSHFFF